MRVLMTTDTIGGVWTFTKELTVGLLERGHAVALVSLGREPSSAQQLWALQTEIRFGDAFRYLTSEVPLEWMQENATAYSAAEGLLLRLMKEFSVDLVHTSQFCFGALPVTIPKVLTAHSDVLSWAEACRPDGLGESDWMRRYRDMVSAGIDGADVIVAPTYWMRDTFVRLFSPAVPMRVILNGRSMRGQDVCKSRELCAVTVGRIWDDAKGLGVLRELDDCMPVLVVGEADFERQHAPELRTVEFIGKLDEDELFALLRTSCVYLATSIYEPFGLAPLEAALCGCGLVARDIPSLREVWGNAAEYFTDADDLRSLLTRLRSSPADLRALQGCSLQRALDLSADRMIEQYVALYQQLVAMPGSSEEASVYAS